MTENREEGFSLDIGAMLRALWKNILIIILVAVLSGALSFGWTFFFVKPQYNATATLYVNRSSFSIGTASFNISSSLSTSTLVDMYMIIIESRTTLEEVAEEAGLDISSKALRKMITTADVDGTGAFTITVTSSDPSMAELIANTIAKILPDRIAEIIDGSSVRIIDYAIIPSTRSSPDYMQSTLMGLAVGAILSMAIVLLKAFLDQRNDSAIHSQDELKQLFPDIAILAAIPDMTVKGKSGYYASYYGSKDKKEGKGE